MIIRAALLVCLVAPLLAREAAAQGAIQTAQELKRLTIEELTELDVTSASRRPERLAQTAAAVSVVRHDDIRRIGITRLPDAMRLADGLDVARVNGGTWAISARGFNINPANKLLVLMDGRSVYSPLSSGTFWDAQDALLADIDRIEVIRGPGGSTWGANAVNGVVNIITKEASATRGTAVLLAAGDETQAIASARHGGRFGASGSYRVYGKFRGEGANRLPTGESADDPLQHSQGGFRIDSDERDATRWSLQGDAYHSRRGLSARPDTEVNGGNILGRWSRRFSSTSELRTQVYYDATYRKVPGQFEEMRHTVDVDLQQQVRPHERHGVMLGGAFRTTQGRDEGIAGFIFEPESRTNNIFSLFVHDEITVARGFYLTLGSKFERNDYTGFEPQPTVRVRWSPNDRQTVWSAVSRAVRLPMRFDTDLRLVVPGTRTVLLTGSDDFRAESVVAVEGGYRLRPMANLSFDIAVFRNAYDDLRSQELRPGEPVLLANMRNARSAGAEFAATVQVADWWRVHGSYTHLDMEMSLDAGSRDQFGGPFEANDPDYFASVRSYVDLPAGIAFDAFLRRTGARATPVVPAYSELDLRLGWLVRGGWELSLVGQNLLHDRHLEFAQVNAPRFHFERGVYLRSAWRF